MRERDMFPIAAAYFESLGYQCWAEVNIWGWHIDLVAANLATERFVLVELKKSLQHDLSQRCRSLRSRGHEVWAVVYSPVNYTPGVEWRGVGVGSVRTGTMRVVQHAEENTVDPVCLTWTKRLRLTPPGGVGGVACLDGEGPAAAVCDRVVAYLNEHPGADWPELFSKVPNHYGSAASMKSSLLRRAAYGPRLLAAGAKGGSR